MNQAIVATPASPKEMEARLKKMMVFASAICLAAVFYVTRPAGGNTPPPMTPVNTAGSGALAKTTQTNSASDVVTKALAFEALLSSTDEATLQQTYSASLARKWSNLPCGASCRNGIEFGNLSAAQLAAALAVIQAATGTSGNNGYDEFMQIRLAEYNLKTGGGGSGYDTTLRWIAFLNTPSTTGQWMLQFGGHHYAANIAFNNGHVIGATPYFMGLEPLSFTVNGTTYAPLTDEHDAFTAMLSSLSATELVSAKLNQTFSDCTMVPGETNGGTGTFPTTKVGIACSTLTTAQKNLVLAAIANYVNDMDATSATAIMATYTNEIDATYIAYTGSGTSGSASSFLNTNSNYVRIDGPTVWIELACQNGVVYPSQIHYHTVWRDHSHDYGVDLTGAAIDGTTGVASVAAKKEFSIYPNPASSQVTLSLNAAVKNAKVTLTNAAGQTTVIATDYSGISFLYDVSKLPAGLYFVRIGDATSVITGKFTRL